MPLNLADAESSVFYHLGGDLDPRIAPNGLDAPKGALYALGGVTPATLQKTSALGGDPTAWSQVGGGVGSVVYTRELHVEPYIGNDGSGDGSLEKPYLTIAAAMAAAVAGGAASAKRYCLVLASGDHGGNGALAPFVSIKGNGRDNTRITGNWSATGLGAALDRNNYSHVFFTGTVTLDYSLSLNCNIRFIDCSVSNLSWNGGPNYPITQANNLFLHNSFAFACTVIDGALHMYEGGAILGSLSIQDGPVPSSLPFAEILGCNVQGTVTLTGKAQLVTRGCYNTAAVTGVVGSGISARWFTDESSLSDVVNGVENAALGLYVKQEKFVTVTVNTLVGTGGQGAASVYLVDATAGNRTITLPHPTYYSGRVITVKKIDASGNGVEVDSQGAANVDGSFSQTWNTQYEARSFISTGTEWFSV